MVVRLLFIAFVLSLLSPTLSSLISPTSLQNISFKSSPYQSLTSNLTFIHWPLVPPSRNLKITGITDFHLTFTRIDIYTREPLPQPTDLQAYLEEFIKNLEEHEKTEGKAFAPSRAHQYFVDVHALATYRINLDTPWSLVRKELPWEVLHKALRTLAGLMTNRAPAVLEIVIKDKKAKEFYSIKTDIVAWGTGDVVDVEAHIDDSDYVRELDIL